MNTINYDKYSTMSRNQPSKRAYFLPKIAKGDKENAVRILFAIENLKKCQ